MNDKRRQQIEEEVLMEFMEGFKDKKTSRGEAVNADTLFNFGDIGLTTPREVIGSFGNSFISKTAEWKDKEWTKNLRTKFEATLEKFHIGIPIEILIRVEKKTAKAIFDEELFLKKFTKTERESLEKKYGVI